MYVWHLLGIGRQQIQHLAHSAAHHAVGPAAKKSSGHVIRCFNKPQSQSSIFLGSELLNLPRENVWLCVCACMYVCMRQVCHRLSVYRKHKQHILHYKTAKIYILSNKYKINFWNSYLTFHSFNSTHHTPCNCSCRFSRSNVVGSITYLVWALG